MDFDSSGGQKHEKKSVRSENLQWWVSVCKFKTALNDIFHHFSYCFISTMEENVFYTDRDIEREANRELSSKSEFTLS